MQLLTVLLLCRLPQFLLCCSADRTDGLIHQILKLLSLENLVELVTSSTGKVSLDEETLGEILSDDSGMSCIA